MKKIVQLIAIALIATISAVKAQKLVFSYDAAGNQTERRWVCINCNPQFLVQQDPNSLTPQAQQATKLEAVKIAEGSRSVKAYPNPVTETLYVNWEITEKDLFVKTIAVFNVIGTQIFKRDFTTGQNAAQFTFSSLPAGSYLLSVIYSDNKRETLKIIKL